MTTAGTATTTTTRRRLASSNASGTRIPVPKTSKATTTTRRASPRRKMPAASVQTTTTRVLRSTTARNRTPTGANKENYPMLPRPGFLSRANPISPSRMKTNGGMKKPFGKSTRAPHRKRVPLRELTEEEVFMRDEAVIGDLRRRRASGENYVVDGLGAAVVVDSVLAHEPEEPQATEASSASSSAVIVSELAVEQETLVVTHTKPEKFTVLRRSDSEERMDADIKATIASASTQPQGDPVKRPRTRRALAAKKQHPAVRISLDSIENLSPDGMRSAECSPIKLRRTSRGSSSGSALKEYAGITKVQASPSPLKVSRVGLGVKSANTAMVMKKVLEEAAIVGEKGKVILGSSNLSKPLAKKKAVTTAASATAKTVTAREVKVTIPKAKSSLKRAAGVVGSTSARAGLAGIARVR
ncbi:hypothetical protein BDZ91DRAFT_401582 [Kalaharituber pfeilii]|nr:hypothetical protein BDZ91DRAFT_401582 [Kalaharituber pfeilii]